MVAAPVREGDAWPLSCPVCNAPLGSVAGALVCDSGHSFDRARGGYVNLLVQQHRERGIDGDTKDMLQARRRFLDAGYYRRLVEQLVRAVRSSLDRQSDEHERLCVAEIGSGEGYYIGSIREQLSESAPGAVFVGADVSKEAARQAARRYRGVAFVVANVRRRIYVETGTVNVLLSIFAPRNGSEFARVVAPGGTLLIVLPADTHLASFRSAMGLIGVQELKEEKVLEQFGADFELVDRSTLVYPLALPPEAARDLISMGPNRWHTDDAALIPAAPMTTEASFVILELQRRGS